MTRLPRHQHNGSKVLARTLRWAAVAVALAACARESSQAWAAEPAELATRVATLIDELDADRFSVRQRAADQLHQILQSPTSAKVAAPLVQESLARPGLSFEVRTQLERWLPLLPHGNVDPLEPAQAEDLPQLIEQLDDNSYSVRLGARRRLEALSIQARHAIPLAFLLRDRLDEPTLSTDSYQRLLALWEKARASWLLSDPATWNLPPPSDREIQQAVSELAKAAPADALNPWLAHQAARRKLLDMLAHDEAVPRIKKAIEKALAAEGVDITVPRQAMYGVSNQFDDARQRLEPLLELTVPSLVAEIWTSRENVLIQYLHVDVPQQVFGAERPSHFSRVDDETAVCKSGNNLQPGEYPVDVAIPHADGRDWICRLVNLPNPRRRQAYQYALLVDESTRLAELTERTMRHLTAKRQPISEPLFNLLFKEKLDVAAFSSQIGPYLMAIEDRLLEEGADVAQGPGATHHQRVCLLLAMLGTRQAGPGLVRAIEARRCRPASLETTPFQWPQIAALAIAARDPWPDAEPWLASQIDRSDPLVLIPTADGEEDGHSAGMQTALPQFGASAAALLLQRHEMAPSSFGLVPVTSKPLQDLECPSFRFSSDDGRQRVLDWWRQFKHQRDRQQTP